MKKIIVLGSLILSLLGGYAQCLNGDAELNNFNNWTGYIGWNTTGTLNLNTFTAGLTTGRHTIMTSGTNDPIGGFPVVGEGSYSFRLGNNSSGRESEILSYTFTAGSSLSFMYALVMEAWHSQTTENGFFSYWISTSNNLVNSTALTNLVIGPVVIRADVNNPFFTTTTINGGTPVVYKEWQTICEEIPAQYAGQQLTIYFSTADCSEAGHFGYAYIDGLCKAVPAVPSLTGPSLVCNIDDPVLFDGSGSSNDAEHGWLVQECDVNGNPTGPGAITPPFNGSAGTFNVGSALTLEDGKYYKVTLRVRNCSGEWVIVSQIFRVRLTSIFISNRVICCGSSVTLAARVTADGTGTVTNYRWYDEGGNFLGNGTLAHLGQEPNGPFFTVNNITVTPTRSTKYRLVYQINGCATQKWVYVTTMAVRSRPITPWEFSMGLCKFPKWVNRRVEYFLSCDYTNNVNDYNFHNDAAQASITYLWNTGATTSYIMGQPNTSYSVTVTTPCGANTYNITLYAPSGPLPNLFIPNAFTPNGDGLNDTWQIFNIGMQVGHIPAYNANKTQLRVWNQWGQMVHEQIQETHTGFFNGSITWNGMHNGSPVNPNDTYHYELILWNCETSRSWTGTVDVIQ